MRSRARLFLFLAAAALGLLASSASAAPAEPAGCPEGMSCSTVTVPLDWSGKRTGKLKLPLRLSEGKGPVLLYLFGGPGQAGTPHASSVKGGFDALAPDYRVAVIDQRGTGGTAIRCNRLQRLPLTDITVRPRPAVRACGRSLGARRSFYTTTSTVRDIEAVRKAIGVKRLAIMGTSYGTYVAARYARAFKKRVSRLILDSVVPQENVDPFFRVNMRRAGKVLRRECGKGRCGFRTDPAAELARLVARPPRRRKVPGEKLRLRVDGPALLDWVTTMFSVKPAEIPAFGKAIHRAVRGNYRPLMRIAGEARGVMPPGPAGTISWGLHATTLCSDLRFPFSIGKRNRKSRAAASARYLVQFPKRNFWPFDRRTAIGNGIPQACFDWQPTRVAPPPKPGPLTQPVLILAGQYDISTPVEYAKRELRRSRRGKLVIVPKAGHAVAFKQRCSAQAVSDFLHRQLKGNPCRSGS